MRREFSPKMFDYRSEKFAARNRVLKAKKKKVQSPRDYHSFDCIQAQYIRIHPLLCS